METYGTFLKGDTEKKFTTDKNIIWYLSSLKEEPDVNDLRVWLNIMLKANGTNDHYEVKKCKTILNDLSPVFGASYIAKHIVQVSETEKACVVGYGGTPVEALDFCMVNEGNLKVACKRKEKRVS